MHILGKRISVKLVIKALNSRNLRNKCKQNQTYPEEKNNDSSINQWNLKQETNKGNQWKEDLGLRKDQ